MYSLGNAPPIMTSRNRLFITLAIGIIVGLAIWYIGGNKPAVGESVGNTARVSFAEFTPPTPLQLILAPVPGGDTEIERKIAPLQTALKKPGGTSSTRLADLEELGWLFVAKGRADGDPGSYKLAERCALAMENEEPDSIGAAALRGFVLQQFHRFKEAEAAAHKLVADRGLAADFGLLSDALMEQGRLDDAAEACQKMLDLKPGAESYVRAAHIRWLGGDLDGARELMGKSLELLRPSDGYSFAWIATGIALYELQVGDFGAARGHAEAALTAMPGNPAAHFALGRILSAVGDEEDAIGHFRIAAKTSPLPDHLWTLAEHLRARKLNAEGDEVEETLHRTARRIDIRSYALYLATKRQQPALALQLAHEEMESRQDIFTWDALAWSQFAADDVAAARESMAHALAEGTQDGRLFLHASLIADAAGEADEARDFAEKALALKQMLLPSERALLPGQRPSLPR